MTDRQPARIGTFNATRPLCAGDLRHIVRRLNDLNYPDECPVQVKTPLPPRDPRCVDFRVLDYSESPMEGTATQ